MQKTYHAIFKTWLSYLNEWNYQEYCREECWKKGSISRKLCYCQTLALLLVAGDPRIDEFLAYSEKNTQNYNVIVTEFSGDGIHYYFLNMWLLERSRLRSLLWPLLGVWEGPYLLWTLCLLIWCHCWDPLIFKTDSLIPNQSKNKIILTWNNIIIVAFIIDF